MNRAGSLGRLRLVLTALICGAALWPPLLVAGRLHHEQAGPFVDCGAVSFGDGSEVGATTDHVLTVIAGDLDGDGDADIASGSWSDADYELMVWQNDGSPFTGLWTGSDAGASDDGIGSLALGDLDNDGDLDLVSGSYSNEDFELIAWENGGAPFSGLWSQNDVGASTDAVMSVALGDLDDDGDLDIISGSQANEDFEVIAWQNDGTPFDDPWPQQDVGSTTDHVVSVALGDLDNDGDLDIVSGSWSGADPELIAWDNDGSPFDSLWCGQYAGDTEDKVRSVALGDLDNDGDLDIVSGSYSGAYFELVAWENDGSPFDALWDPNDMGTATANVRSVALGDLDQDGDLDAVSGNAFAAGHEVVASQNDGTPFSGRWNQYGAGHCSDAVHSVALADLDSDGDLDIVSGSGIDEDYELMAWRNYACDWHSYLPLALKMYSGRADIIFRNGVILTMEPSQPQAAALAVRGETIIAVGTDSEVMALQGPDTQVVNLGGRTLLPGFIDGHTHVLGSPDRGDHTLDDAMDLALSYGLTTVTEMSAVDEFLAELLLAEQQGTLRLRVNVFPAYNSAYPDEQGNTFMVEAWFPDHGPILDADRRVRIPGVKVSVDGGWSPGRGCWALTEPYPEEVQEEPWFQEQCFDPVYGDLYLRQEQLDQVVADAQAAGFSVSFHVGGDRAIEHVLNAIESAQNGGSNLQYRHQIQHSSVLRPDQMSRYVILDILASLRGYFNTCEQDDYIYYFGVPRYEWLANRYALPGLGIHVYAEGDFHWDADPSDRTASKTIDPMLWLYGLVTHQQLRGDGTVCQPDQWIAQHQISVEQGLRMLTIEPAFAVRQEDAIGSLRPGKFADLVILSGNPLTVNPDSLKDLQALMTMVGGHVEYCAAGYEILCPGS